MQLVVLCDGVLAMLKALIVAKSIAECKILAQKLQSISGIKIVHMLATTEYNYTLLEAYQADLIITNNTSFANLVSIQTTSNLEVTSPRQQIKAITHHGIRLVPVANICYFQAEHKYVTAHHMHGQLLIEDSLNDLEREFANTFIRIHRKTLVAKAHIESLRKNELGQYCVYLVDRSEELVVSRRQLPNLRKILLCL